VSAARAWREHACATEDALASAVADALARALADALAARGRASMLVSGGTTPIPVYARLAQTPLAWDDVTIGLTDDRWVPVTDPASNEGLVRRTLLVGRAAHARLVGLYTGEPTPEAAVAQSAERIGGIPRPFDVVLLGMGEDGHTASLFPRAPGLGDALSPDGRDVCVAGHAPDAPRGRMSLTVRALLDARALVLMFAGERKRHTYEAACGDGPESEMPVRAILRQRRVPLDVYWAL
jgi:6-phosphogluconolactonase